MANVWVVVDAGASPGQRVSVAGVYTLEADAKTAAALVGIDAYIGPVELDAGTPAPVQPPESWPEGYYPARRGEDET